MQDRLKGYIWRKVNSLQYGLRVAIGESHDDLVLRIAEIEKSLRETQLSINHGQNQTQQDIKRRVENTGVISLSETEILVKIFSGAKMYLDPRDIAVVPHLALDTIWEHRITAAWLHVVQEDDVVIDIGANFGYFGVIAAQHTNKKSSRVIMFEANPHLIPYIEKTVAVNWLREQSVIENLAIAESNKQVELHILKDYIGSSSIHSDAEIDRYMHNKMHVETQESVKVKAVALDDYCAKQKINAVHLIKMDIEGYEDKAYQGMREIVRKSPDVTLFIEFTKEGYKKPKEFYQQMLDDFGNVYVIDDDGYIVRPKDTSYETVIGESDDWTMPIFSKKSNLSNR